MLSCMYIDVECFSRYITLRGFRISISTINIVSLSTT